MTLPIGNIYLDDQKVQINTPIAAQKNGISLIHQEPQSFSHLSVAENIFMGHMDGSNFSRVKWKDINKSSEKIIDSLVCYGKRICAYRMGINKIYDRNPGLTPTNFGIKLAKEFANLYGLDI